VAIGDSSVSALAKFWRTSSLWFLVGVSATVREQKQRLLWLRIALALGVG